MTPVTDNQPVNAERSRSGAADQVLVDSTKAFINPKLESNNDPVPRQLDPDQFLLGKSSQLKNVYSDAELEKLRWMHSESIERLKDRHEKSLFRSSKRRQELHSVSDHESFETALRRMWELKKSNLLLDIYDLIFKLKVNYCLVFLSLEEFLTDRCLRSEFSEALSDPLTLMVTSVMEYAEYTQRQANRKSGLSESKS